MNKKQLIVTWIMAIGISFIIIAVTYSEQVVYNIFCKLGKLLLI